MAEGRKHVFISHVHEDDHRLAPLKDLLSNAGMEVRDECLSVEWFRSRSEAKVVIETWRLHFNAVRPHSSLNYLTPLEFKQQHHPVPNRAVFQE